jgi:hypothetical protein
MRHLDPAHRQMGVVQVNDQARRQWAQGAQGGKS